MKIKSYEVLVKTSGGDIEIFLKLQQKQKVRIYSSEETASNIAPLPVHKRNELVQHKEMHFALFHALNEKNSSHEKNSTRDH